MSVVEIPTVNFNVDNGYLEGLIRGMKGGIIKQSDYLVLIQCETLEGMCTRNHYHLADLKLHLQDTDYGNFLANEAGPLTVSIIEEKMREKLVSEFRYIRNQAFKPLSLFLDYIT